METTFTLDMTTRKSGLATLTARMQVGAFVYVKCNGRWEQYKVEGRCNPIEMFKGYATEAVSAELDRLVSIGRVFQ
jgi:hypothetical protein